MTKSTNTYYVANFQQFEQFIQNENTCTYEDCRRIEYIRLERDSDL